MTPAQALEELGFTREARDRLETLPFSRAVQYLASLKEDAKRRFKRLVFEHHPDRNPGNEKFAQQAIVSLTTASRWIESARLRPVTQPPKETVTWTHRGPSHPVYVKAEPTAHTPETTYFRWQRKAPNTRRPYDARRAAFIRTP